jgi:dTDP-glucose 4,6-dehydratase
MKKWLVTGGCGFIGSNFVLHLLSQRPDAVVVNLDTLTYAGNLANLAAVEEDSRHVFVKGDIRDPGAVNEIFATGVDYVVNFAAESHVDRSIHDSSPFVTTNIEGVQILLDAARAHGVGRFLQV